MIGNKAVAGSGIAATAFGTSAVEVLYMDEAGNGTFSAEYLNGQWFTPSPITTASAPELMLTSSMAISYATTSDNFHAFYTGADTQIYEFIVKNATSDLFPSAPSSNTSKRTDMGWTNNPDTNGIWGLNQGPGAPTVSTAWLDQVMFFQMVDGDLFQSTYNTTRGARDAQLML